MGWIWPTDCSFPTYGLMYHCLKKTILKSFFFCNTHIYKQTTTTQGWNGCLLVVALPAPLVQCPVSSLLLHPFLSTASGCSDKDRLMMMMIFPSDTDRIRRVIISLSKVYKTFSSLLYGSWEITTYQKQRYLVYNIKIWCGRKLGYPWKYSG